MNYVGKKFQRKISNNSTNFMEGQDSIYLIPHMPKEAEQQSFQVVFL